MNWPYLSKRIENTGTEEAPIFSEVPFVYYVPSSNRGPYQMCGDCTVAYKDNPKHEANYAIQGSRRCAKHILRYHKSQGTLTDELKADVAARDLVHVKLRQGAYYGTKDK